MNSRFDQASNTRHAILATVKIANTIAPFVVCGRRLSPKPRAGSESDTKQYLLSAGIQERQASSKRRTQYKSAQVCRTLAEIHFLHGCPCQDDNKPIYVLISTELICLLAYIDFDGDRRRPGSPQSQIDGWNQKPQ